MNKLITSVKKLQTEDIAKTITKRLKEFDTLGTKNNNYWFSELCFCILTANSKAITAINIQNELGYKGFLNKTQKQISTVIKKNKHRFHNNKSNFIVNARQFKNIKTILKKEEKPREWIVKNIKGVGYKEASHFLRNVGYTDYAILDRHIINILLDNKMIKEKPKTLTKKTYLEIEVIFKKLAKKLNMSCSKLDLYLWYIKTGTVLK